MDWWKKLFELEEIPEPDDSHEQYVKFIEKATEYSKKKELELWKQYEQKKQLEYSCIQYQPTQEEMNKSAWAQQNFQKCLEYPYTKYALGAKISESLLTVPETKSFVDMIQKEMSLSMFKGYEVILDKHLVEFNQEKPKSGYFKIDDPDDHIWL